MAIVKYTKPSLQDLKDIRDYIAIDSVVHAKHFVQSIKNHIILLNKYPVIGSLVFPNRYKHLRQLLHKAYRIVYYFEDDVVTILTVLHQSRLIQNVSAVKNYTK